MTKRVFLWNAHWETAGGGERYAIALLNVLQEAGYICYVLGTCENPNQLLENRLGIGLSSMKYVKIRSEADIPKILREKDIFINGSFGSTLKSPVKDSIYICHFPQRQKLLTRLVSHFGSASRLSGNEESEFSFPFRVSLKFEIRRRLLERSTFAGSYGQVWANSSFTRHYVKKYWKVDSEVNFPPVNFIDTVSNKPRQPFKILSVGRFMDPRDGHSKNQLILISAFKLLQQSTPRLNWELILIGGVSQRDFSYFQEVCQKARGLNIRVIGNASRATLMEEFETSTYFWHGTGIPVSKRHPEKMEHFGISVVEAISAGLLPLVHQSGGVTEIIANEVQLKFRNIRELSKKQGLLAMNDKHVLLENLSYEVQKYSVDSFSQRTFKLLSQFSCSDGDNHEV